MKGNIAEAKRLGQSIDDALSIAKYVHACTYVM